MEDKNDKRVIKCLKSYLTAKKYYDSDIDKSMDYLKQCIRILNDLKEKNIKIKDNMKNLIEETETECSKYLTKAIELTIEKPINKIIKTEDENELFEIIEIGAVNKLNDYSYGNINFNVYNNEGLTPLHCAIKYGDTTFIKKALKLGGYIDQTNKFGHTLLEYACLEKDPNMINFLSLYGADMKKHLIFRDGKKYFNNGNQIDILILEKKIIEYEKKNNLNLVYLDFILKYVNENLYIELEISEESNSTISKEKIKIKSLINKIDNLISDWEKEKRETFIEIIKEELENDLSFKLGCPTNKIEIILYNLVPFIDENYNLKLNWLISLEIKFLILKVLKNKVKINTNELKKELNNLLLNLYIKPELVPEGLLEILVIQWLNKIKV